MRTVRCGSSAEIISGVTAPGRRMVTQPSSVQSTMVDSTPHVQLPPSRMSGIRPVISAAVIAAVVGLGRPEMFAEGAAIGTPAARMSRRATSWAGQRTPTVDSPPVTSGGICAAFGTMTVMGPGANAVSKCAAAGGTSSAASSSMERSAIWRMSGLSEGRPFAS